MKPQRYLMLGVLLALLLAACSSPTPEPLPTPTPQSTPLVATVAPQPTERPALIDDSWRNVERSGVLRVGTSADYPPFEAYNDKFQLDGFDIALIQAIGQKLGLKVELNDFAFDGLGTAVAIDQVDVAIGALSVTPDRQAVADFSNIYYASDDAVLSRPDAALKDLRNTQALAAARLGVQTQSVYENYARDKLIDTGLMPKQNLFVYTDIAQAVADLKAKRIDVVWLDLKPAQSFASAGDVKILAQNLNQQLYAIALKKGADNLRDKINGALQDLQSDGTLVKLKVQYLRTKPEDTVPPVPVPTPVPSQPTPVPPTCLDSAQWVADLSYDDKNMTAPPVLQPGQPFTKGWRMRNNGTCVWKSGYVMAYSSGNVPAAQMGGQPIPVTQDVNPGGTFDFNVNLIAPIAPGTYQGFWNMRNAANQQFGETVWVGITVPGAATPTPAPTQTPVPNISFTADRTNITAGEPVLFTWSTENVKAVYFYHDGQNWQDHGVPGVGQSTEYPPYTINYYLRVIERNEAVVVRTITIYVNPAAGAPVIDYFGTTPTQVVVGQCVSVDWAISGQVDQVTLLINNAIVWDGAPITGNYQDCPVAAGNRVYTLQAAGPGGTATQQTSINVQNVPPTAAPPTPVPPTAVPPTPVPPTAVPPTAVPPTPVPPTAVPPTPVPTTPAPQPPVIQNFGVTPNNIQVGQCVVASWSTGGGTTRVQLLRDKAVIWDNAPLNSSIQDCPPNTAPGTVAYSLVAYNNAGQKDQRDASVQVSAAPQQNPLANTSWVASSLQGSSVPSGIVVTAYFDADGTLTGSTGCNPYNTTYVISGSAITIALPLSTGALCGDPADTTAQTYLALLPQAKTFELGNGVLTLRDSQGQALVQYALLTPTPY